MKKALFFFLGFYISGAVSSQIFGQVKLTGKVIDNQSGEGLPGARIIVADQNTGSLSDENGNFEMTVSGDGVIRLTVTYIGYDTLIYTVKDVNKPLKLGMETGGGVSGETVTIEEIGISEKQKMSALTVESMSSIAIQQTPSADFYAGLSNLKGVDLTSASIGFRVINTRGFNSTSPVRSLQIIDGVDNQAPGLSFSLGNFLGAPELDVQNVDLVVGASSAFYGPNAFNGVISMTTKDPFVHPGLSVQVKGGERNLFEGSARYAKVFKNKKEEDKFAFKINLFYFRAYDWEATNMSPTPQSTVGENNPGGYDAVNRYGDENLTPGINNASSLSGRAQSPGLETWHRTGYNEKDLVDYNSRNLKTSASLHYKITSKVEALYAFNFGTGTTVYQGENRFSLKNILFFQNRFEIRQKDKFFFRVYSTKEDAGDSYDAVFTAFLMQNAVKSNNDFSKDYRNYWNQNIESKVRALPGMPPYAFPYDYAGSDSVMAVYSDSLIAWHALAREYADSKGSLFSSNKPRIEPGTAAFDSLKNEITSGKSLAEGGTKFIDYSALYHAHGEYKFNLFNIAFTTGANGRLYRPNSEGTIFSDTGGRVIKNYEYGLYAGLERFFWEKKLKANLTGRLDKNQNFNFLVSPAASVVYVPKENQIIRLSFSSAIRNPTLQDQFLYYNVGRAILVGNISGMDSLVTISSLYDNFNTQNYDTLDFFNVDPVRPEKVKTFEVGYRTILFKKLYVDAQYYYSFYRDFIGYKLGAEITYDFSINRPTLEHVYRVAANSSDVVTTQGAAIGADYYFGKYYSFSVNYSWNELNKRGSNDPIIPAFNTPKHKFNLGFSGRDIQMKLGKLKLNNWGFNFNFKWIQGFLFEGSPQFTGTVPTYWMLDGQVNKSIPKMHLTFKLGASNILNRSVYQVYGGPAIGRLAYISILLNLDKL